jgi:hypothetical protein
MQIKNQFDQETLMKILRGSAIAGGGAFSVYALEAISTLNFGEMTPVAVAICSILINAIREYNSGK